MNAPSSKKNRRNFLLDFNQGFTLIELLVTIIIIGVLGAIALPSFLNQVAKARGAEAKSNLGALNRSQQSYRWENHTFASDVTHLDIKLNSKFYNYQIPNSSSALATAVTVSTQNELKSMSAAIAQTGDQTHSIVCESNDVQASGATATIPDGDGNGTPFTCPNNYHLIE